MSGKNQVGPLRTGLGDAWSLNYKFKKLFKFKVRVQYCKVL